MEPIPATWIDAISKLGFPTALLIIGIVMAWKFGKSFHATVVVPIVTAHVSFLQEQTVISRTVAGALEKQTDSIEVIKDSQLETSRSIRLLAEIRHRDDVKGREQ